MFAIKFDSKMRAGWFWLSFFSLSSALLQFLRQDLTLATKVVLFLGFIINPGILVFLIEKFRNGFGEKIDSAAEIIPLSAWGYLWRGYLVYFSEIPIIALVKSIVPIELPRAAGQFSAIDLMLLEVPFMLLSIIAIWLLFSRDRIGQAKFVLATFRGY